MLMRERLEQVPALYDKRTKRINFHKIMKARGVKYPFLISNTDRPDKKETH